MSFSKTTYFILPILGLKGNIDALEKDGLVNSYLGWRKHLDNSYGQHLYVLFDAEKIPGNRAIELENHQDLIDTVVSESTICFIFNLSDDFKKNVITPFIDGKYSQISREFVEEYHPKFVSGGYFHGKNKIRGVFDKSEDIKEEWEEVLNTKLPQEAEVWSIPSKEEEILDYFDNITETE